MPSMPSMPSRPPRRDGGRGGRDFRSRRKVCVFCVDKVKEIDYKDTSRLRRFISDRGKIEPRRKTGTCAKHQRRLSTALKRARFMALLPYTGEHIRSIEAGGHGSHTSRADIGRPEHSRVETPPAAVAPAAVAPVAPGEGGQGAPPGAAQAAPAEQPQPVGATS
jgi:small subunit ribosomal protein S18